MEALQGQASIADLCTGYEIHQIQYYQWCERFLSEGAKVFQRRDTDKREEQMKKKMVKMERVIGELTLELKK